MDRYHRNPGSFKSCKMTGQQQNKHVKKTTVLSNIIVCIMQTYRNIHKFALKANTFLFTPVLQTYTYTYMYTHMYAYMHSYHKYLYSICYKIYHRHTARGYTYTREFTHTTRHQPSGINELNGAHTHTLKHHWYVCGRLILWYI